MHTKDVIFFIHIPKAGGTSMRRIVINNFNIDKVWQLPGNFTKQFILPNNCIEKIQDGKTSVVIGHMTYGAHKYTPPSHNYKYISMLRDPVNRAISNFYYAKANKKHYLYQTIQKFNGDINRFIPEIHNWEYANPYCRTFANPQFQIDKKISQTNLEQSISNIDRDNAFVGLTEYFNESLFLLNKFCGIKYFCIPHENKNPTNIDKNLIKPETIAIIKQRNLLDYKLYNHVKKNLIAKIDSCKKENPNIFDPPPQNIIRKFTYLFSNQIFKIKFFLIKQKSK